MFQVTIAPQLPSPALDPTSQVELYLCSLKVPGHSVKYSWSEGLWPLFLVVVVMLPDVADDRITIFHAQIQGMATLGLCSAVNTGEEPFPGKTG